MQLKLSKFDSGSAFRLRLSARETIRGARVMPIYTYATLDDPSSSTGATVPLGINDAGQIVGGSGNHGFLLSGGTYTALNDPLGFDTTALGINASGQIVGSYQADGIHRKGFLYDPSRGIFPPTSP